jgi:hypothetical protein
LLYTWPSLPTQVTVRFSTPEQGQVEGQEPMVQVYTTGEAGVEVEAELQVPA